MSPVAAARRLWRGLVPESLRRAAQPVLSRALAAYVRASARAPHGAESVDGPIRVVGFFEGSHGIAASARLAVRAFEALGVPVEQVDVSAARLDWLGKAGPAPAAGPWIFHLNPPELLAALAFLGPRRVRGPRYGYWAWELPRAPDLWLKDGALVDGIWAPSAYTAQALSGAAAPVRVVPHPFFLEDYRDVVPAARAPGFLAVSLFDFNSAAARKNPEGVIGAFARAFGDDPSARLVMKTQNGHLFPDHLARLRRLAPANVAIEDAVWPYAQVKSLIASADVLVSLHRAEGFGLTPAEAMALGTPVIATGWSGNLDFMDASSALLIPARQIPVEDSQGIYRGQTWADPDLDAAAEALRRVRAEPDLARRLADNGRRMVAERLSPQAWFTTLPDEVKRAAMAAIRAG
ncbi:glycosyltransferase family 4 protein [Phenylobacterium sp.]|uniref:glycosyltransferase family 4 protein n=1 Tax=Phenylobacterium sp. TaxID=1871053 RepID=UPI00271FDFE4|nr:glycosyltransferase [Phenylobacterium sp.]MDO8380727.1 glycosyltransferase [Phenylobacterium sp.]